MSDDSLPYFRGEIDEVSCSIVKALSCQQATKQLYVNAKVEYVALKKKNGER
jgi:hypothetical protein